MVTIEQLKKLWGRFVVYFCHILTKETITMGDDFILDIEKCDKLNNKENPDKTPLPLHLESQKKLEEFNLWLGKKEELFIDYFSFKS